jgi:hypothetical protein
VTFEELKEVGFVHLRNYPLGYSVHPTDAAAVFNSACLCTGEEYSYRIISHDTLEQLVVPATKG